MKLELTIMAKTIDDLQTYQQVMQHFEQQGRKVNLLLGNGFSIAYDRNIFSYNSLSRYIMESDDELVKRLFKVYNTQNFETIMQQLRNMVEVLKILDAPDKSIPISSAHMSPKKSEAPDKSMSTSSAVTSQ